MVVQRTQWRHNERDDVSNQRFAQPFVQAQMKENINAARYWPLWREFTGDRWIPLTKASNAENASIWWRHRWIPLTNGQWCGALIFPSSFASANCLTANNAVCDLGSFNPLVTSLWWIYLIKDCYFSWNAAGRTIQEIGPPAHGLQINPLVR